MDKDSLGTAAYFEVRWREADGGSSSARFNCPEFQQALDFYHEQKIAGKEPLLVSVATVQLLPPVIVPIPE